jgi:hypothetical protein
MMIKASGRAALILATGLFVCLAGPLQAAASANEAAISKSSKSENAAGAPVALSKYARHGSRHWKKVAHRKSSKLALKSPAASKAAAPDDADDSDNSSASSALPPSVANANAQLASADTPAGNAKAMSARANNILQAAPDNPAEAQPAADTQVMSSDQLNDVDRALREAKPAAAPMKMASADAPVAPVMAGSGDSSTWDQTSLIGKIFIGFGALLTMASAARMFMA